MKQGFNCLKPVLMISKLRIFDFDKLREKSAICPLLRTTYSINEEKTDPVSANERNLVSANINSVRCDFFIKLRLRLIANSILVRYASLGCQMQRVTTALFLILAEHWKEFLHDCVIRLGLSELGLFCDCRLCIKSFCSKESVLEHIASDRHGKAM